MSRNRTPSSGPRLVHVTTVGMTLGFLRDSIGLLKSRGVDVHAACAPGADARRIAEELGITLRTFRLTRRISPVRDLAAVLRMAVHFARLRPILVHGHTPKGGLVAMVAATLAGVPVRVYHLRGLRLEGAHRWRRRLLTWTERLSCHFADVVIAVGPALQAAAIEHALVDPGKIVVLSAGSGQGVDAVGRFDPRRVEGGQVRAGHGIPRDATAVGYIGRLVRDKGVVELFHAWKVLRESHPDLHLLLVGPWELQDPVPAGVRSGLEDDPRVHIVGAVADPAPYYAAMDVVAFPSYREGFPNVPLEAAAMEIPVVASDIPGCRDAVVDGRTGTLTNGVDALTEALDRYIRDPGLRAAHGRTGRERVLRLFRPERISRELYDEYNALLERKGLARLPDPPTER